MLRGQTSADVEELGLFLNESVAAGTEGLIVKTLDSTYEPSRRSAHWLKLKKDYLEGVGDTFDVAVIGAWLGKCAPARRSDARSAQAGRPRALLAWQLLLVKQGRSPA